MVRKIIICLFSIWILYTISVNGDDDEEGNLESEGGDEGEGEGEGGSEDGPIMVRIGKSY